MQTHICRQDCYDSSLKWDRGDCFCFGIFVQSKKVERDAVSSSESEDEKEDKKMTVSYKSTRSAVSWLFLSYWLFKGCPFKSKGDMNEQGIQPFCCFICMHADLASSDLPCVCVCVPSPVYCLRATVLQTYWCAYIKVFNVNLFPNPIQKQETRGTGGHGCNCYISAGHRERQRCPGHFWKESENPRGSRC